MFVKLQHRHYKLLIAPIMHNDFNIKRNLNLFLDLLQDFFWNYIFAWLRCILRSNSRAKPQTKPSQPTWNFVRAARTSQYDQWQAVIENPEVKRFLCKIFKNLNNNKPKWWIFSPYFSLRSAITELGNYIVLSSIWFNKELTITRAHV